MTEKIDIRNKQFPFEGCTASISDAPSTIVEDGKVIYARYEIYCSTEDCALNGAGESGSANIDKEYNPHIEFQSAEALSDAIDKIEETCLIRNRKRKPSLFIELE